MSIVLGIHSGHHASCAVVRDGRVVAAVQQERVTRAKHDGQEGLSNRLPITPALESAGVTIDDVDLIVSSFQAASPGGSGLHRPLVHRGFDRFDPYDRRHVVISHHRAHALSAIGASGYADGAALVCDLAGSTTLDGDDFEQPFGEFEHTLTSVPFTTRTFTECLSIYRWDAQRLDLMDRAFCLPHTQPDVFVQNVASLYDNVTRTIFHTEHAHGQMMALAALGRGGTGGLVVDDLVQISDDDVTFRNDWQHRVPLRDDVLDNAPLAAVVQEAFQRVILAYARRTKAVTGATTLVAAGGVFLNILANSEVLQSGLFERFFVPSSPHDAGISVGCAFAGLRRLAAQAGQPCSWSGQHTDRVGPQHADDLVRAAVAARPELRLGGGRSSARALAELLADGRIIARSTGRSEFGPRALGGRSLLASPLRADIQDRLNAVKGRQSWRPVAPVIRRERVGAFFDGPEHSPYMNFVHNVRPEHRDALLALHHPDGSTRAQTLDRSDDPALYDVLVEFEALTGYPILVNTSLNGRGEPIIETPEQAVHFFITHPGVDLLLLNDQLVARGASPSAGELRLAPDTIVSLIYPRGRRRILLTRRGISHEISKPTFAVLDDVDNGGVTRVDAPLVERELQEAFHLGLLTGAHG
jgi:carbamoyltransferase